MVKSSLLIQLPHSLSLTTLSVDHEPFSVTNLMLLQKNCSVHAKTTRLAALVLQLSFFYPQRSENYLNGFFSWNYVLRVFHLFMNRIP